MGMRITTSMMMNTYRFNLQNSTGKLNDSRNKVMSQRKFESYAEDPASATQAWRIRRAMSNNFDYQTTNKDTNSRFNIAWTTMGVVNHDLEDLAGRFSSIRGENGAIGAGRQPLGKVLSETAETIIQALNGARYGDHYVFSGRDEMNPPFTWSADMKTLYYRGVNVGAGAVKMPEKPAWAYSEIDKKTGLPVDMSDDPEKEYKDDPWALAWAQYYQDQAKKRPAWTYNQLGADGLPEDMPKTASNDTEQKWMDYYKDLANTPDWVNSEIDPVTGAPVDIPASVSGDNATENKWFEYYKKIKDFNEQINTAGDEDTKADLTAQLEKYKSEEIPVKRPESAKGIQKPEAVPAWTQEKPVTPPSHPSAWDEEWITYLNDTTGTVNRPEVPDYAPAWGATDEYGIPEGVRAVLENPEASGYEKAWAAYYVDQGDVARLKKLAEEEQYVDLGMGLEEKSRSELVNGTAFDRSLPGINMLGGYGLDEDGDPRNVVLIMRRLGELFSESDPESGAWAHPGDAEEAMRLMDKLTAAHHRTTEAFTEIDTSGQFLQNNQEVLETQGYYLQEERYNLENLDPADAITEFMWDYNCYSAALKIGTQLLSQSLIDYMT